MSDATPSAVIPRGKDGDLFTGFRIRTCAGAIHALLSFGRTPLTEAQIRSRVTAFPLSRTVQDVGQRVNGHLQFWRGRRVYLLEGGQWKINPAVQWSPEWNEGLAAAKAWYDESVGA